MKKVSELVIYQTKAGALELRGDFSHQTIWATQAQMAHIFGVNPQAITKHIKNIYSDRELEKVSTCSKMEQVQVEGKRRVKRKVDFYNLDLIISVGYRINSLMGTKFRQWATKTLRHYITEGFSLNRSRIKRNYEVFIKAVDDIRSLLPANMADTSNIAELIKRYAVTWLSLDAYDKARFPSKGVTLKQVNLTAAELKRDIVALKNELLKKKQATELFAIEREQNVVEGIVGNVFQSFGGEDVYPSIELKAAHLLYFVVKNHPFTDGNKRSGAFAFIWFLHKANLLDVKRLSPQAVTAITLLTAESKPRDKEKVIGLILMLLG